MPRAPAARPVRPARDARLRRVREAFPYALFLLLVGISWNRWIEPYVDGGRELAVPWRLAKGEALYRDVRFYHGPLAPFLAAGIDGVTGRSIPGRIFFGAAIALLHVAALRRLAGRLLSPGRAVFVTGLTVAATFFLRPGGCHLFPFSFDTAIAVAAIAWTLVFATEPRSALRNAGTALGLLAALLSRAELGLAAIVLLLVSERPPRRLASLFVLPLTAAACAYAALSAGTPLSTLRREGWLAIVGPPESFRNIYASYAGLDRPALRLAELALAAIVLALLAALLATAAFLARRVRPNRPGAALGIEAAAVLGVALIAFVRLAPSEGLAPTLSLFPPLVRVVPAVVIGAALWRLLRRMSRARPGQMLEDVPDALLTVTALFSARLLLAAGYAGPYSAFLLPLPLVVSLGLLLRGADRLAPALGPAVPRLAVAALGILLLFRLAVQARDFRGPGWSRVETPVGDLWLTEPVAGTTRLGLSDLAARLPSGGRLVGFPEAGFFHYSLGLTNPLPQEQFFPGHLDAAAEADAIARLRRDPPDAVLYANVLAIGHRATAFGRDYLIELDRFLRKRSEPAASYGPGAGPDPRVGEPQFFLEIRVPGGAQGVRGTARSPAESRDDSPVVSTRKPSSGP